MSQMGHIRKHDDKNGRTRYQIIVEVWKDGQKVFKSKTFGTEKEAKSWGNKTRYEIEKGLVTKESLKSRKLSDANEKFLVDVLPQKPKNARHVQQHLTWWKEQLGNRQLVEVTAKEIAEYRDYHLRFIQKDIEILNIQQNKTPGIMYKEIFGPGKNQILNETVNNKLDGMKLQLSFI
ncbi:MAG: hypothetical protein Q8K60_03565 [Parachlamydiaceae bacterium]|nr:hypothetical protein [Parachlamydiaceae bacterium]